jgi:hypothetical protein
LRTVDGREVDLLIETEKGYYAIEIKMSSRVSDVDARHLKGLGSILDKLASIRTPCSVKQKGGYRNPILSAMEVTVCDLLS